MVTKGKILQTILAGSKNIRFSDVTGLLKGFGFRLSRTEGSHHIFVHSDIPELLNHSGFIPRGLPRLPSFRRKPESRETDWIPCQARNDIGYPPACGGGVSFFNS